ncbi:unnamed protein product [Alopecurus aequalis]
MEAPQLFDEMPLRKKPTNAPSEAQMDDLQDDVLPIIASFLPAHDAVRTCVLARRWRHVWTFAPALRITAVKGFGSAKFSDFVDHLLSLRRQGPLLKSCEFDLVQSEFDFNWYLAVHHVYSHSVQSALDCNVEVLMCRFTPTGAPADFQHQLPESATPLLSQHVHRLELDHIPAALDFSGCPALTYLQMERCILLSDSMVSASLKHLSITCCELNFRHRTSISLPNLVHLELIDCYGRLPLLESLPSLVTAVVSLRENSTEVCEISDSGCLNDDPCWGCRFAFEFDMDRGSSYFFQGLSRATHLELSASYNHAYILQRDLKWCPTFPMLKTLLLDDWCLDADLSVVIHFIQKSPNLEKLTLDLFEEFDSSMVTEGSNLPLAEASVFDHLKMVEIKCEKIDGRVDKVLKILNRCGISQKKIDIQQTD